MYHLLLYSTVDDFVQMRIPLRKSHQDHVMAAFEKGTLLKAGALGKPADGVIFVFKDEQEEIIEEFAKNDPYVTNGLVSAWAIRLWNVNVGE